MLIRKDFIENHMFMIRSKDSKKILLEKMIFVPKIGNYKHYYTKEGLQSSISINLSQNMINIFLRLLIN